MRGTGPLVKINEALFMRRGENTSEDLLVSFTLQDCEETKNGVNLWSLYSIRNNYRIIWVAGNFCKLSSPARSSRCDHL